VNIYSFVSLSAFIICLFLGWLVYWKNKTSPVNRSFAIATVCMGTWSSFPFVATIASTEIKALFWSRVVYIAAIFTATIFWHFVRIMVGIEKKRSERIIIKVSYIVSALFLFILFRPDFIQGIVRFAPHCAVVPGPLYRIFVLFFGLMCLDGFRMLLNVYKTLRGYKRSQVRYLFLGLSLAFVGGIMHFLAAYVGIEPFPHDFLIIAYSLIMAYAIVAHRLMDINVVITRGVAYAAVTTIIAGTYIVLMAGVDKFFSALPGYNPALAHSFLFIAVLFALIYVLPQMKIRALEITRRTLFRGRYDYQQELSEATRLIPTMLNLAQLCDYVVIKIRDTLMPKRLMLFVYDETGHEYLLLNSFGLDRDLASKMKIAENTALAGLLRDTGRPIVKEELKKTNTVPQEAMGLGLEQLTSLEVELCIPLMLHENLIGILALGNKGTGEMYTDEDLSLLSALANQVALTIEYIKAIDKITSEKRFVGLGKAAMRMAHDIKNPLVPLKAFLQILPNKYPEEFAKMASIDAEFTGRFYESALEGVDRINLLIERALHYARHPQPMFSQIELNSILEDVLIQEEVNIKKTNINLEKMYAKEDNKIVADAEQLIELFSNLIANSIDAVENSPTKKLIVKTKALDGRIVIEIIDTGCGISKDKLDTIFDPFITYKHKGSGLGLAIVKKIVDDHRGRIEVDSEPGKGTSFKIVLPRKQ
jgi:signal transduction histidine kinase